MEYMDWRNNAMTPRKGSHSQMSKKVSYLLKTNKHPTPTHTHTKKERKETGQCLQTQCQKL